MTADSGKFLYDWLQRIEEKLDRYFESLAGQDKRLIVVEKAYERLSDQDGRLRSVEAEMNRLEKVEEIEQQVVNIERKVAEHDPWIRGIKWTAGILGAAVLVGALTAAFLLLTHGNPVERIISTAVPIIVTATPWVTPWVTP